MGNITHLVDLAQQPDRVNPRILHALQVSSHCDYTYDPFYQLASATGRVHRALQGSDAFPGPHSTGGAIKGTRRCSLNDASAVERYRRDYSYDLAGNIHSIVHTGLSVGANR